LHCSPRRKEEHGLQKLLSINSAIEKQGESRNVWKKEEIAIQKEMKEKDLTLWNDFMQKKKIDVELTVMGKTCAIQVEKSKREAEHLEDQKITVMHDS
jgi:hypothetical protein